MNTFQTYFMLRENNLEDYKKDNSLPAKFHPSPGTKVQLQEHHLTNHREYKQGNTCVVNTYAELPRLAKKKKYRRQRDLKHRFF